MPASYSLGQHFEGFVRRQVGSGRFASASEVVREGLRLMESREAEREARLEGLRAEVARGRESGPGVPADAVFAEARQAFAPAQATPQMKRPRPAPLDRDTVVKRLRAHKGELKRMGIRKLSLFGSVARGEARPDSDVDLAAELDRDRKIGLFEYAGIAHRLEELLGTKVDLVTEPARKPRLQAEIDRDRVDAF